MTAPSHPPSRGSAERDLTVARRAFTTTLGISRRPVTSHEVRFMRERLEGESQRIMRDIVINYLAILEREMAEEETRVRDRA